MFPVELPEEIYKSFAKSGEVVYEPFSGSGTSIIACEKQGLRCMAMELSPKYVDVAIRRWHEYTGKIPVNEAGDEFPIGCAV
jgi:DNA modification methylase